MAGRRFPQVLTAGLSLLESEAPYYSIPARMACIRPQASGTALAQVAPHTHLFDNQRSQTIG